MFLPVRPSGIDGGPAAWAKGSPRRVLGFEGFKVSNFVALKRAENLLLRRSSALRCFAACRALRVPMDLGAFLLLVLLVCSLQGKECVRYQESPTNECGEGEGAALGNTYLSGKSFPPVH